MIYLRENSDQKNKKILGTKLFLTRLQKVLKMIGNHDFTKDSLVVWNKILSEMLVKPCFS